MLLAVDVGNSNISFGLFEGRRLVKKTCLPTYDNEVMRKAIRTFSGHEINAVLICSVVPKIEKRLASALRKEYGVKPLFLGREIRVPIRNLYKRPRQVGQDRLVNAYAAFLRYMSAVVVVDFGTAVTFDIVSKSGAYLGGVILPGIELSLEALSEKAALLPRITLKKAPSILGRTTSESMASGIYYGFAAMCDGLVKKLRKDLRTDFKVIATGGDARVVTKQSALIKNIDVDLTLKGINSAYMRK